MCVAVVDSLSEKWLKDVTNLYIFPGHTSVGNVRVLFFRFLKKHNDASRTIRQKALSLACECVT